MMAPNHGRREPARPGRQLGAVRRIAGSGRMVGDRHRKGGPMPRGARGAVLAGLVLCLLAGLAGPAWAGPWVDRTAGNLRDDPLYVNSSARPTLSLPEQERIRARLALAGTPVFVAILPGQALAEVSGDANQLAALVAASVGRPGTYLAVAGGGEGAGSNTLAKGQAANRATVAFRRHPQLSTATMDFIARVEDAAGTPP